MVDIAFGLAGESLPPRLRMAALSRDRPRRPLDREDAAGRASCRSAGRRLPDGRHHDHAPLAPRGPPAARPRLFRERARAHVPARRRAARSRSGEGTFRKHQPAATLYSPRVTTGEADEVRFLAVLEEELAALGVNGRLICGRRVEVELEEGPACRLTRWPSTACARPIRSCCSAPGWGAGSRSAAACSSPTRPSSRPIRRPRARRRPMTSPVLSEPAAMVDLTGLTCPGPILGAREILEGLRDGQVLLLLSDCPGTRDDLFAWARRRATRSSTPSRASAAPPATTSARAARGTVAAHVRLDLRGVSCPGPIVEARQLLKGMRSGEVLKLVSDCPGVRDDIAALGRGHAAGAREHRRDGRRRLRVLPAQALSTSSRTPIRIKNTWFRPGRPKTPEEVAGRARLHHLARGAEHAEEHAQGGLRHRPGPAVLRLPGRGRRVRDPGRVAPRPSPLRRRRARSPS